MISLGDFSCVQDNLDDLYGYPETSAQIEQARVAGEQGNYSQAGTGLSLARASIKDITLGSERTQLHGQIDAVVSQITNRLTSYNDQANLAIFKQNLNASGGVFTPPPVVPPPPPVYYAPPPPTTFYQPAQTPQPIYQPPMPTYAQPQVIQTFDRPIREGGGGKKRKGGGGGRKGGGFKVNKKVLIAGAAVLAAVVAAKKLRFF